MDLSNPHRFRRQVAGLAMIIVPPLIVVAELLHARFETDAAEQLTAVADSTGRWYAAHTLVLIALALAVPAFLGVVHMFRKARPTLGHLSLVLFVPGLLALTTVVGMELVLWQMAQPERNRTEMVALADRVNESPGIVPIFLILLLFPIAWLLAGIGLYAARTVPVWSAVLIGLSQPLGFVVEFGGGPKAITVAAQIGFAVGLVPVGLRVLRQKDEEWAEPAAAPAAAATA